MNNDFLLRIYAQFTQFYMTINFEGDDKKGNFSFSNHLQNAVQINEAIHCRVGSSTFFSILQ